MPQLLPCSVNCPSSGWFKLRKHAQKSGHFSCGISCHKKSLNIEFSYKRRENITCLCVWGLFFSLFFWCAYVLTFLNDPYNLKKIFWFVFLSNDNLLSCNTGLDEVETRMFDILYPLCVENMEKQQTLELSRARFSAIGVTLPCVSN